MPWPCLCTRSPASANLQCTTTPLNLHRPNNKQRNNNANNATKKRQAFIGRLDNQKGADLVLQAAPWLMAQGCQLVCLGTGAPDLEAGLRWLEATFPEQARGWVGFNVAMSHKITAGADILLMPSR